MDLALSRRTRPSRRRSAVSSTILSATDLREGRRKTGRVFSDIAAGLRWHKVLARRGWSGADLAPEHGGTVGAPPALHLRARVHGSRRAALLRDGHPHGRAGDHEVRHPASRPSTCRRSCGRHRILPGLLRAGRRFRLASLKTRALRDGEDYVINGHQDLDHRRACRRPHVLPGAHLDRGQAQDGIPSC